MFVSLGFFVILNQIRNQRVFIHMELSRTGGHSSAEWCMEKNMIRREP